MVGRNSRRTGATLAALAFASFVAHAAATTLPGPLVSAKWLHGHLQDVTVVDVLAQPSLFTAKPRFAEAGKDGKAALASVGGHVPGAHLVAFHKIRTTRKIDGHEISGMLPTPVEFQTVMRDSGVDGAKPIVISCAGDGVGALDMAARLYWTLKTFGSKDVAILNGGTAAWLQAGYAISTEAATPRPGNWTAGKVDMHWFADSNAVAKAHGEDVQLVDARSTSQFLGITKKKTVLEYGHIKGARSFPTDAIVRHDGVATFFMTEAEYHRILPQLGIKASAPTITYCNTGHLASGAWFVMREVLGNHRTRLYDGSMLEWTTEARPVVPTG